MVLHSSYRTYTSLSGEWDPFEACSDKVVGNLSTHEAVIKVSWWQWLAPYAAEFVGTLLLTLTFLCNSSSGNHTWAVTSNAFMVMALVYALNHISGSHLNPSVSIALWLSRRLSLQVAGVFCCMQVLGGATAAALFHHIGQASIRLGPQPGFGVWESLAIEVIYTAMICFVYLNCAAARRNNPPGRQNGFVGLAVGLCHVAGGYASMGISGTVMNPAIAIGMQIVALGTKVRNSWAAWYLPFELCGAFLAAGAYRVVRPGEFDRSELLGMSDQRQIPVSARVMAEFIGTFCVVFTRALNNIKTSEAEAWSVAASLASMVYALRNVSGGHFNPAVTFAATVSGRGLCSKVRAAQYIAAQVIASLSASSVYALVNHGAEIDVRPSNRYPTEAIIITEVVFTSVLCYAVLATSVELLAHGESRQDSFAGLAIGSCAAVGGFAASNVSGGLLNPAMALGFTGLNAIDGKLGSKSSCAAYIAYELIGGLLAALVFFVTHIHLYGDKPGAAAELNLTS